MRVFAATALRLACSPQRWRHNQAAAKAAGGPDAPLRLVLGQNRSKLLAAARGRAALASAALQQPNAAPQDDAAVRCLAASSPASCKPKVARCDYLPAGDTDKAVWVIPLRKSTSGIQSLASPRGVRGFHTRYIYAGRCRR